MNERALKVLEQYELEIAGTRRGRGNFICETDKGSKQLCEFHGSEKKLDVAEPDPLENQGGRLPDGGYCCGEQRGKTGVSRQG